MYRFFLVLITGIFFLTGSANASLIVDLYDGGSDNILLRVDYDGQGSASYSYSVFYWSHNDFPSDFITYSGDDYDYYPADGAIPISNTSLKRINLDDDGSSSDDFKIYFWQAIDLSQAFTVTFELPDLKYSQLIPGVFTDNTDSDTDFWGGYELRVGQFEPVPEPSTIVLLGFGLLGMTGICRKGRGHK